LQELSIEAAEATLLPGRVQLKCCLVDRNYLLQVVMLIMYRSTEAAKTQVWFSCVFGSNINYRWPVVAD